MLESTLLMRLDARVAETLRCLDAGWGFCTCPSLARLLPGLETSQMMTVEIQ